MDTDEGVHAIILEKNWWLFSTKVTKKALTGNASLGFRAHERIF